MTLSQAYKKTKNGFGVIVLAVLMLIVGVFLLLHAPHLLPYLQNQVGLGAVLAVEVAYALADGGAAAAVERIHSCSTRETHYKRSQ